MSDFNVGFNPVFNSNNNASADKTEPKSSIKETPNDSFEFEKPKESKDNSKKSKIATVVASFAGAIVSTFFAGALVAYAVKKGKQTLGDGNWADKWIKYATFGLFDPKQSKSVDHTADVTIKHEAEAKPPVVPKVETPVVPKVETPVEPKVETPVEPKVETPVVPEPETPVVPKVETPVVPKVETPVVPEPETPVSPNAKTVPTVEHEPKTKKTKTKKPESKKPESKKPESKPATEPPQKNIPITNSFLNDIQENDIFEDYIPKKREVFTLNIGDDCNAKISQKLKEAGYSDSQVDFLSNLVLKQEVNLTEKEIYNWAISVSRSESSSSNLGISDALRISDWSLLDKINIDETLKKLNKEILILDVPKDVAEIRFPAELSQFKGDIELDFKDNPNLKITGSLDLQAKSIGIRNFQPENKIDCLNNYTGLVNCYFSGSETAYKLPDNFAPNATICLLGEHATVDMSNLKKCKELRINSGNNEYTLPKSLEVKSLDVPKPAYFLKQLENCSLTADKCCFTIEDCDTLNSDFIKLLDKNADNLKNVKSISFYIDLDLTNSFARDNYSQLCDNLSKIQEKNKNIKIDFDMQKCENPDDIQDKIETFAYKGFITNLKQDAKSSNLICDAILDDESHGHKFTFTQSKGNTYVLDTLELSDKDKELYKTKMLPKQFNAYVADQKVVYLKIGDKEFANPEGSSNLHSIYYGKDVLTERDNSVFLKRNSNFEMEFKKTSNDAVLEETDNRNKRFKKCECQDEEGNTFILVRDTKDAEKPELVQIAFNVNEKNFLLNKEGHLVFGSKKYFLKDDELWQSTRGKDGKWYEGKVKQNREHYELIKQACEFVEEKNLKRYFHEDIS